MDKIISELEKAWDIPNGMFYRLRYYGDFDKIKFEEYIKLIKSIEIDEEYINKRLVSLLWYLPLFMGWQIDNLKGFNKDTKDLENAINKIISTLVDKLGVP